MNKVFKILLLTNLLICSCNTQNISNTKNSEINNLEKNISTQIKGKAIFSEKGFSIKADPDIATKATVSLIYPPDYSNTNLRNTTIATGITDQSGYFVINLSANFQPNNNDVFILDASKRINGIGSARISLRTYIKKTSSGWESITGSNILINKDTTSITLISNFASEKLSVQDSINKISYNNGVRYVNYDTTFTQSLFNKVIEAVIGSLLLFKDPVENVVISKEANGEYKASSFMVSQYSTIKSNMHAFQTLLETYAVDWSGIYPPNSQILEQEAKDKKYWREIKNPFSSYINSQLPPIMDFNEYENAKNSLTYKGINLSSSEDLKGIIVYKTGQAPNQTEITNYFIYGIGLLGDFLKDNNSGNIFYLTNY